MPAMCAWCWKRTYCADSETNTGVGGVAHGRAHQADAGLISAESYTKHRFPLIFWVSRPTAQGEAPRPDRPRPGEPGARGARPLRRGGVSPWWPPHPAQPLSADLRPGRGLNSTNSIQNKVFPKNTPTPRAEPPRLINGLLGNQAAGSAWASLWRHSVGCSRSLVLSPPYYPCLFPSKSLSEAI